MPYRKDEKQGVLLELDRIIQDLGLVVKTVKLKVGNYER